MTICGFTSPLTTSTELTIRARTGSSVPNPIRAVYKVEHCDTLNVLASSMLGKARIGLEYALHHSVPNEYGVMD